MTWKYVAGFFDGEGSITNNGKGFRVSISQTNQEVLETIRDFVGFGFVIQPRKRKEHWKDCWVYYIAKQKEVYSFLLNVSPFLIVKRQKAESSLPLLEKAVRKQRERQMRLKYRIKTIKRLRNKGLTYRAIGKRLDMDWGYARRLFLR